MRKALLALTALPLAAAAATALAEGIPDPAEMMQNPSSNIAWTADTLALVASGDPGRGETLHTEQLCSSCHGDVGIGQSPNWPSLSGQVPGYTYKTLRDYHDWERSVADGGELMGYIVEELSDQDMADLAAFYRANPRPPAQDVDITPEQVDIADTLHWLGDPGRLIQPCSACHGETGRGVFPNYPSLTGQYAEYTRLQLELYRSGARHSDIYGRMRLLSAELTDEEIDALALYYAQMGDSQVLADAGGE
jgi:cytochrome c553